MPKKKKIIRPIIKDITTANSRPAVNGVVDGNFIKLKKAGIVEMHVIDATNDALINRIVFEVDETDENPRKYKWIYKLLNGEPHFTSIDRFPEEALSVGFSFPQVLEGGGLGWIEPFLDEPKNKKPAGYFISAKGDKHKSLLVRWRKASESHTGEIIDKKLQLLKDNVELHIYTQGLYGQEITVRLLVKSNEVDLYEKRLDPKIPVLPKPSATDTLQEADKKQKDIEKQKKEVADDMEANKLTNNYFVVQVKAYNITSDERTNLSNDIIIDGLSLANPKKALSIPSTQKAIIPINLDPLWRFFLKEGQHEIYPEVTVKINNQVTTYRDNYIIIDGRENPNPPSDIVGNTSILVSDIVINPSRFQLCKYSMLSIRENGGEQVKIFAEEELSQTNNPPDKLYYGVIAGESSNAKNTITLKVDGLNNNTSDCTHNPKHQNHVIDDSFLIAHGYQNENRKKKLPSEKKENILKLTGTFSPGGGFTTTINNDGKTATNIIEHNDEQLTFDVNYNYEILNAGGSINWDALTSYIWLHKFQANAYQVSVQTCRWRHLIHFAVYPDLKWTLGFKVGLAEEKFKKLNNDFKKVNTKTQLNPFQRAVVNTQKKINSFNWQKNTAVYKGGTLTPIMDSYANALPVQRKERRKDSPFSSIIKLLDDYEISLKAEWNNGQNVEDFVEALYQLIDNTIAGIKIGLEFIEDVIDGETASPITMSPEKGNLVNEFLKKIKKKPVSYNITNPSLGVALSWYFENINQKYNEGITNWGAGVSYAVALSLNPVIGIEVTIDFVQLLSRRHPIAFAIVAACKAIETLLGQDEDMIKIQLKVTGKIMLDGNLKYNTVGGFVISTGKKAANNAHVLKGGAAVTLSLEARIHLEGKVEIYYVAQVKAYIDAGVEGSVGVGVEAKLGSDQQGMFVDLIGKFDGVKLKGDVKIDVEVKRKSEEKQNSPPLIDAGFEVVLGEATHKFFTIRI